MASLAEAMAVAVAHHQAGRLTEAAEVYRRVLAVDPEHADALHLCGVLALQQGRPAEALERIERAVAIAPEEALYRDNLGQVLLQLGRTAEAAASFRQSLALDPYSAVAHNNLGTALQSTPDDAGAAAAFRRAIELDPSLAEAWNNLGNMHVRQGDAAEAVACYRRAIQLRPGWPKPLVHLAGVLLSQGQLEAAEGLYAAALELGPSAKAHSGLGDVACRRKDFSAAEGHYRRAIAADPRYLPAHSNLGGVLFVANRFDEAEACYRAALAVDPAFPQARNNLGTLLHECGDVELARQEYEQAVAHAPPSRVVASSFLSTHHYLPGITEQRLLELHLEWDAAHGRPLCRPRPPRTAMAERPLRLGFVSADLADHPVGRFLVGAVERLDPRACVLHFYHDRDDADGVTERIRRTAAVWRQTADWDDERLDAQVRADAIDVLFDLAGHTAGNRMGLFARGPAPVQITWMGYVGTTGVEAIDYLLADRFHVPPASERYYREKVLRLPHGYVCWSPPEVAPAVGPLPAERNGWVTFGCFNNAAKINDRVVEAWAELLCRVPDARLLVKGLRGRRPLERLTAGFARQGIGADRLLLEAWSPKAELLAAYNRVDLALDTFPYSGGLTTLEALWMGVPTVTFPGRTFAGRHSTSHLSNAGLAEFVAADLAGYIELAAGWAADARRLADVRRRLRQQVAASPLCDAAAFAADLLALLRGVAGG